MYKKEEIHEVIKKWNELYEKIYEVVELHGKKDDVYYDIVEINQDSEEHSISVQVEFYKWQDNNEKIIYIDTGLLTNQESFDKFKSEVEKVVSIRQQDKIKKLEEKNKKEIEAAIEILKKNGIM